MSSVAQRVGAGVPLFASVLGLFVSTVSTHAAIYSAAADFNIMANPRGNWSYGVYAGSARGVGFSPFMNNFIDNSIMSWGNSALMLYNYTPSATTRNAVAFEPRQIVAQPALDGRPVVLRFTAHAPGNHEVSARFIGRDTLNRTRSDISVLVNGAQTWSSMVTTYGGSGVLYTSNLVLREDDTVDFVVGDGGNGPSGDAVGLTVTIRTGCVADVDDGTLSGRQDGGVGIEDLLYFLIFYEVGFPLADVDNGTGTGTPDGGVGIEDLLYYLQRYDQGC